MKVIIVGAGIAGMSAGAYARKCGFDVTIYEAHSIPGGAVTSWCRKGYLFEVGMNSLTGSSPKISLNRLWREVGALDDSTPIYNCDPVLAYEQDGKTAYQYRDIDRLETHLLELSPEDKKEIKRLCKDLKKFTKIDMPISDIKGVKVKEKSAMPISTLLSMLPAFIRLPFYSKQTLKEYAMRYKSPLLQKLFMSVVGEESITGEKNSADDVVLTISTMSAGDGGYPVGGSLGMAKRMAEKFVSLGGVIQYNTWIDKVKVNNGVATGVIINGEEIPADAVIVTQDALVAIDTLFDKPIREPWAETMRKEVIPMLNTYVCLGVKADLSDIPETFGFDIDKPILHAGYEIRSIVIDNYATFQGYAPEGCTALTASFMNDSYDWWKKQKAIGTYESEKRKLAEAFIGALTKKYPQLEGKVEVWDVATNLTFERYLHSYKGSSMSITGVREITRNYPSKPKTISNLYFAGQRVMLPGGLPSAVCTGRQAVQYLCKDTDTVFVS